MNIFIDIISQQSSIILFEDNTIFASKKFDITWKEFDNFFETILEFLRDNNLNLSQIKWFTIINWPWWFTSTRIITLVMNTINFTSSIKIDSIDYFEFLEICKMSYPMIIKANRSEYLIKESTENEPLLVDKENIKAWTYSSNQNAFDFENNKIYIKWIKDYSSFINNYKFNPSKNRIEPYYIKKPNIS